MKFSLFIALFLFISVSLGDRGETCYYPAGEDNAAAFYTYWNGLNKPSTCGSAPSDAIEHEWQGSDSVFNKGSHYHFKEGTSETIGTDSVRIYQKSRNDYFHEENALSTLVFDKDNGLNSIYLNEYARRAHWNISNANTTQNFVVNLGPREEVWHNTQIFIEGENSIFFYNWGYEFFLFRRINPDAFVYISWVTDYYKGTFIRSQRHDTSTQECQYQFTSYKSDSTCDTDNSDFQMMDVCSREDNHRYVMCFWSKGKFTDCSCKPTDTSASIATSGKFNYPDCKYLSSLYDLSLNPTNTKVVIDNYNTTRWNDLLLPNRMDSLEIDITVKKGEAEKEFGSALSQEEKDNNYVALTVNTDFKFPQFPMKIVGGLTVNGDVTIETQSEYVVKYLTAKDIIVDDEVEKEKIVFSARLMNDSNFESLKSQGVYPVCGVKGKMQRFMRLHAPTEAQLNEVEEKCDCTVSDSTSFEEYDCDETSKDVSELVMIMKRSEYDGGNTKRYWKRITFTGNGQRILSGEGGHQADECLFTDSRIYNINTDLYCKSATVSVNARIKITGKLTIGDLTIVGTTSNKNGDAIFSFESGDKISISQLVRIDDQTEGNCLDLIASSQLQENILTYSKNDFEMKTLEEKVLRICKTSTSKPFDETFECATMNTASLSFSEAFAKVQCPCSGEKCVIDISSDVAEITMDKYDYNLLGSIKIKGNNLKMKSFNEINKLIVTQKDTSLTIEGETTIQTIEKESTDVTLSLTSTSSGEVTINNSGINLSLYPVGLITLNYADVVLGTITETPKANIFLTKTVEKVTLYAISGSTYPSVAVFYAETPDENQQTKSLSFTITGAIESKAIIYNKNRQILSETSGYDVICDNQVLMATSGSEPDSICPSIGITKHLCYVKLNAAGNKKEYTVSEEDERIDYSCTGTRSNDNIILEYHVYGGLISLDYEQYGPRVFYLNVESFTLNVNEEYFSNIDFFIHPMKESLTFTATGSGNTYTVFGETTLDIGIGNLVISGNDNLHINDNVVGEEGTCSMMKIEGTTTKTYTCLLHGTYQPSSSNGVKQPIDYCKEYLPNGVCSVCKDRYYLSYDSDGVKCKQLTISYCIYGGFVENAQVCYKCEDGYVLSNNACTQVSTCATGSGFNGYCITCLDGKYGPTCTEDCPDNCSSCQNSETCLICETDYLLFSGKCYHETNAQINGASIISCDEGYYLTTTDSRPTCQSCNTDETDKPCLSCESSSVCSVCKSGYNLINGKCVSTTCSQDEYFNIASGCTTKPTGCAQVDPKGNCLKCSTVTHYIETDATKGCSAIKNANYNNCKQSSYGICLSCDDGTYLNGNKCEVCELKGCKYCTSENTCGYCELGYVLKEGTCIEFGSTVKTTQKAAEEIETSIENCVEYSLQSCTRCAEGYYVSGNKCQKCSDSCVACSSQDKCTKCKIDQYLTADGKCDTMQSLKDNQHCLSIVGENCQVCDKGYYVQTTDGKKQCSKCDTLLSNCLECDGGKKTCSKCAAEYVLLGGVCQHYSSINHCLSALDGDCNECATWYALTSDRKSCASSPFGWGVALIVIACVVFLCIIAIIIEILLLMYQKHEIKIQRKRDSGIFSTKHCEEELKSCASMSDVVSNITSLEYDETMELNKEYAKGFYIGNEGTEPIEAVIDIPEDERFGIHFMPLSAVLEPKKCAFFTCFFTPYCSANLELPFKVKIKDENDVKGDIDFSIKIKTEESKNIDSNDLKITETIKETTDIIIYRGTYKDEVVKIREIGSYNCDGEDEKLQYELPYKMLEMFQSSDFIGKYIGKCLFENRHLVVTEFSQRGTMQDLLKSKTKVAVGLRNRIIYDTAKGLQLIHSKSFLHYNIKPSNILIMSTDGNDNVVAKITDFGYEYNVKKYHKKMLIHVDERPIYVAPEIFNGQKYTSQSDVYAFGMCMYVIQTMREPYTESKFEDPWNIAKFVAEGNRLPQPEDMDKTMFDIIANSWEHCCADRYSMDEIVGNLKKLFNYE